LTNTTLFTKKSAQELLAEFNATGRQQPFEEIVRRYAGMVYNVCLRVTKNAHDAEDATQAVFLALAAQGKTGKPVKYIGPWLQQVGRRLSLDIRRSRTRRARREEIVGEMHRENGNNGHGGNGVASCPSHQLGQTELRALLNEELNQLPSKYRLPLILHYFGGLSRDEMAKELGVKANTLGVRVCRGRDMLARRLASRGVTIGAAAVAALLADSIRETVADTLIASTCQAATSGSGLVASAAVSSQVVMLAESVARVLLLAKVKGITAVVLLACTVAGGAEAAGRFTDARLPALMPSHLAGQLAGQIRALLRDVVRPIRLTSAAPGESFQPKITDEQLLPHLNAFSFHPLDRGAPAGPSSAAAVTVLRTHQAAGKPSSPAMPEHAYQSLPPSARAPAAPPVVLPPMAPIVRATSTPQRSTPAPRPKPQNITIDGRHRQAASRTLTHGSMAPVNLTVGDRGSAVFRQSGGFIHIAGDLVVGARRGSSGVYRLDGGELSADNQIIGKAGKGELEQTDGSNTVRDTLYVGFDKGSEGTYALSGGEVTAERVYVPKDGTGTFKQTGGTTIVNAADGAADLVVAAEPGSTGSYHLADGTLQAEYQVIGDAGDGHFVQRGGINDVAVVDLGAAENGAGHYALKSGTIRLDNVELSDGETDRVELPPTIRIGGAGDGSFLLGGLNRSATIVDLHGQTGITVRSQPSANGEFRGWGVVDLHGPFINNGRVIADGFGNARALDFTAAASVENVIDNPDGTSGWFARRGGRLLLPPLQTRNGTHDYTWGEDADDESLDLINSLRVRVSSVTQPDEVRIALFALDRLDLPELPEGHSFLSTWSVDTGEMEFGHIGFTIRYDDLAAASLGVDESILKLWRYDDGMWQRIDDESFGRDIEQNLIWGRTDDLSFLGVSAPEPSCVGALVLGAWTMLRRVRKPFTRIE
jgi:RNA polymerase sigma factor (sigma-70 family)